MSTEAFTTIFTSSSDTENHDLKNKGPWACANLAKYYNRCKCISGDSGIHNSKADIEQEDDNFANKNVVISNIHMQMICNIPVLFGKLDSHANSIHRSHMTTNIPFQSY